MPDNEIILGIDLGTTFTTAAYVNKRGRPTVIPNAEGETSTPSVVLIEDGQIRVGTPAARQSLVKPERVVQWIKRSIGDRDYKFQGMDPVEISAEILKKVKADCEEYFAGSDPAVLVRKAVITCPAYFSANEVENTLKAGQLAGFEVQEIVREPIAAAIYYGMEYLNEDKRLLVCDLGGGKFDASVLTLVDGAFYHLAAAGDRQLGGHDWTMDLLELVAERLTDIFGEDPRLDPSVAQHLYDSCEQLKRNFARLEEGTIPCVYKDRFAEITVTRAEFERLTEWRVQAVLDWTEKALAKCALPLTWEEVDHILLVGGGTRLRRIPEALEQLSGKQPVQTADAGIAVALGAAILARGPHHPRGSNISSGIKKDPASGLVTIDFERTAVRDIGTRVTTQADNGLEVKNSVVIPQGESLPTQRTIEGYYTSAAGQAFVDVPVVEFDDVGADALQQTYRFELPADLPEGTPVQITFRYDINGQIDVEAVERHSNRSLPKQRLRYQEPDVTVSPEGQRGLIAQAPATSNDLNLLTTDGVRRSIIPEEITVPNVPTEQVSFTAYHPREGQVEVWQPLLVYAHALSALAEVREDAKRFEDQIKAPKETTTRSSIAIARGTELTIVPACEGVTFNPERVSFKWIEDIHRADFRFKADRSLSGDAAKGQITIYIGPLIIGTLKFAMLFNEQEAQPAPVHTEHAKMYGKDDVFISYSRRDTEVARVFKTILAATGMDVFIDVDDLRSGQLWKDELLRRIERAGIFQMFWSENYIRSENCRMEWQHALKQNKGEGYIRPVYWHKPLSPNPPEELGKFNFQYVELKTISQDDEKPGSPTGSPLT